MALSRGAWTGLGRRRFARIEVDGTLYAHDITHQLDLELCNISFGGFQALSPVALRPGDEHVVRVHMSVQAAYDVRATVVHCQRAAGARPRFVVGWQVAADPETTRSIAAIIRDLTTAESFESPMPEDASRS